MYRLLIKVILTAQSHALPLTFCESFTNCVQIDWWTTNHPCVCFMKYYTIYKPVSESCCGHRWIESSIIPTSLSVVISRTLWDCVWQKSLRMCMGTDRVHWFLELCIGCKAWWCHDMETLSILLEQVDLPHKMPVMQSVSSFLLAWTSY